VASDAYVNKSFVLQDIKQATNCVSPWAPMG
jgi:hypothetical protein